MEEEHQPAYIEEADEILSLADEVLRDDARTDRDVYARFRKIVSENS